MTTVQSAVLFSCAAGVAAIFWLLVFVRNLRQDRLAHSGRLEDINDLRWSGWAPGSGWAPVTCWYGCANLHREDWWREHLSRTCWEGCTDLHRADWWRVYLDKTG